MGLANVVVEAEERFRVLTGDVVPPAAREVLLVEDGAVGAKEGVDAPSPADVEDLAPSFYVGVVT